MKQLVFFIIAGFAIASCNNSEQNAGNIDAIKKDSSKFTTIQWLDTAVDFGTKQMGGIVNITFRCKNTGDKPLYLYDVRPSCGCTVADYTKEPIAPGKEGKVEAQFDSKKSHPGDVHKTIFVSSNNSNYAPRSLKFFGVLTSADSTTAKK
jgi:hypothetical protein